MSTAKAKFQLHADHLELEWFAKVPQIIRMSDRLWGRVLEWADAGLLDLRATDSQAGSILASLTDAGRMAAGLAPR
jgi:hypothetical protein